MKLWRFEITTWQQKESKLIWFEYMRGCCKCRFLTICNVLFCYYDKECVCAKCLKDVCICGDDN